MTLAVAGIAALIGVLQARKARNGFRSRSAKSYTRAAVLITIGIGAGIAFKSEPALLIVESLGFLCIAAGLVIQGKEAEVFMKIAGEQRIDFLSGLPNARAFNERLAAEHSRTKRTGMRYAIAVFEIDDYHSLPPADKANGMKLLAKSLEDSVRNTDSIGHISEEHVAVMMVDTAAEGGIIGCERARERFFFQSCAHDDQAHVTRPLTVSIGIAAFDEDTVDPIDVVENSKLALQRLRAEEGAGVRIYERADFVRRAGTAAAAA
ncbi:MAG: GGDEF domain-containing protein [Solirubrobacterales bacterium]